MPRDQSIKAIRPEIPIQEIHTNPIQVFQDKTLRPILKYQHDLIITIYNEFLDNHKIDFSLLSPEQINLKIDHTVKQNSNLQALLKGTIIALFTNEELIYWKNNKTEVNKRIIQLIIKRIQSVQVF